MSILSLRSNIILSLCLLFFAGCKTTEEKAKAADAKKKQKEATLMRFHLEVNPDGTGHNAPVPVYRHKPIFVNVQKDAVLDVGYMVRAELVDVDEHGGFAIKLTFNDRGAFRLDNLTTSFKGQRLAIYAQWDEVRWLAAPRISRRIANGVFIFTPDASREEAERIVNGLNNVITKVAKPFVF